MIVRRLKKRPKQRFKERNRIVFPRHQKFIRSLECIVPGCPNKTQFCHVRRGLPAGTPSWARGGTGMKPHDAFGYPGCEDHHIHDQHRIGERSFELKHGVDLLGTALDLARRSPCPEVREFARGLAQ